MKLIEQFAEKFFNDVASGKQIGPQSLGTGWLGTKRFHNGLPAYYRHP